MSALLFIRHAETDLAGTFCGHSDPPVNAAGQRQIAHLVARLRCQPIAAIYTSDLQRALTTARAIAESFNLTCITRPALREIDFGAWEGHTWQQIETRDPVFAAQWIGRFPKLTPPLGESFAAFETRVTAEMTHLLHEPERGPIAVVTHAGVIRMSLRALGHLDDQEAWKLTLPYCGVYPAVLQEVPA